jgi:predicted AAA+ superfamily ATPase
MNKDRLKEIMFDQREVFNRQKHLIERNIDYDRYIRTGQVVIVSGIRRCGKSSLLFLFKQKMHLDDPEYCYFNFDDERILRETDILEQLNLLHLEIYGTEPVFFFDEIQNIEGWEKFINRFYERGAKIFVTGSNARLLSSEISTSLTGRNQVLALYPFSFQEFLTFSDHKYNMSGLSSTQRAFLLKDFNHYMSFGGFPLVIKETDLELVNAYFQDILYRDIISRFRLSQVNELRQIGLYFASNTGNIFSYSTIQKFSGIKSLSTIKDYLWYYEQSFLFFYLKKFDYSVKKQIMNPKKVFTIDPSFSNRLGFNFSVNMGKILENIVFLELLRKGKDIYYHSGKHECDFLVREGLKVTEAIQVTWIMSPENMDRELNGLAEAMNEHGLTLGLLITHDEENLIRFKDKQIRLLPCWKWLLQGEQ